MLLALDIGNSNISIGVFELSIYQSPKLVSNFKISSANLSSDEYVIRINELLSSKKINCITCAVISSVVPNLTDTLYRAAEKVCGKKPFVITNGIRTGLNISIKNPEQLGSDIVCNCAAALELVKGPAVILDMGTATTLTVIDKKLTIIGSIIIPGMKVALEALFNSAAQLSDTVLEKNVELIGKDTKSAISSGVLNGNALMIDGFVRNIREELGITGGETKLSLIATGGLSGYILPFLRNKFTFNETLTLFGLALLYQKNN